MNKTGVSTYEKVMIPLRLSPESYQKVVEKVQEQKKTQRGYSINQYVTELIDNNLQEQSCDCS